MKPAFGIDLGTTRTSIAFVTPLQPERGWHGTTEVVPLGGSTVTPSAVLFDHHRHIVGAEAKNMGHRSSDCAQVFKREMPNDDWRFSPRSRVSERYSATDLSRMVLEHVATQAGEQCGIKVEDAVITVPAYFGDVERRRTREAGERAALNVLDIVNEPTAAVLAYIFQPGAEQLREPVLVFDLGGGTFDTVVVDVKDHSLRVAAIDGDLLLGGRDFDSTIAFELASKFIIEYPGATPPTADPDANARLMLQIESARESLSSVTYTNVAVWGGGNDANRPYNAELSRTDLENLLAAQIERCVAITKRALDTARESGVVPTRVLFVGGTTKMPALRERVMNEFKLTELRAGADPDLLVAKGAAIWGQKLLLEEAARGALNVTTLSGVDWSATESRAVVTRLARDFNFGRDLLLRMLQLQLHSITSRGYAIACYAPERDEHFLAYLMHAQSALPFSGTPESFSWNEDIDEWELNLYEDSAEHRDTRVIANATKVQTVKGDTHRRWVKGSSFHVKIDVTVDQIIHIHAWHDEGDAPGGELRATIDPRRG